MNITLDRWACDHALDLSISAKAALVAIIRHCPQGADQAAVSVTTVAHDINAVWETARTALRQCVKAGYLAVDKPANSHAPTVWHVLTSNSLTSKTPPSLTSKTRVSAPQNLGGPGLKDGLKERGAPPARPNGRAGPPVEKPPPRPQTFAERRAEEERLQAERDIAVARLVAPRTE